MKTFSKFALAAAPAFSLALAAVPAPALAQSKLGIAVVNIGQAIDGSAAATTARSQMQVTYKGTIDSLNTRRTALEAEMKQKADALQAGLKAAGGKPSPALQTQYEALQRRQQEAQAELQRLSQPVALANAYVEEQIGAKLNDALKSAMSKAKVDLVLSPEATVSYQPAVDITQMVVTELNALVPAVGIVPPAGWQPGQAQQAAPAAPAAAAAPAAPAKAAPTGR
ncbi:OmpH family outer membrane protein [Sphingobium sp. DEHP117]|uniref:OmpH family outer membrane protein n=1 Tax=Sphingobium sp. DEHP117 TaxID=2993436 RepID=UPI0027D61720|nr:OmpH family outer membrane protein [Sphingobium sp. DEHP117]MDQ4419674.1 OmpH family outer membrane protein [Sphingobium sp. DEHP117]